MRSKFDEQLHMLNQEMMHMGSMIEDRIQKAIEALIDGNTELAKDIMESDNEVDREQKLIEGICFNLLMQQQPVARDLRCISAAMKMVTDMERIGDHAADISEMTIMMKKISYPKQLEDLKKMASETVLMLIRSIEAYVEKDMEKAQKVIASDDMVDDLFDRNKNDIIEMIHKDPAQGEQAVDLLMVAKYFERIGDHATNIAEWVIFALDDKKITAGEK
ncbi:MAG: phosphate signaling complex protein PhoU [Lachnospiraceae bacterium]|nr:phosphate signaling complex protein PhoU [Lachnospiraceae bacterium]